MQAISFLAGVVTQGVQKVGSAVARPASEGETGFNALLAKAIGNARADEGGQGSGSTAAGNVAGEAEDVARGTEGVFGNTGSDSPQRAYGRSGDTESIEPEAPEGSEDSAAGDASSTKGIAIHGGTGQGGTPSIPVDMDAKDQISIHGGRDGGPAPIGVPMPATEPISIHGGRSTDIAPIGVDAGPTPDQIPNEGPDTIDPFDRIRLDRARQPERIPGGFDTTGMRSGGTTTGGVQPLSGGITGSAQPATPQPVSEPSGTGRIPAGDRTGTTGARNGVGGTSAPAPMQFTDTETAFDADLEIDGMEVDGAGATTGTTHANSDPRTPDRDLDRIHPELRTRLERVVERMAAEHGHRVELVEGYRSAERQNWLYAQRRQRPGQVVTWTRNSMHMEGLAADLNIDGGWDDPAAFAKLQRIAQEEGLSTLGMRDPGHVEFDAPTGFRRADMMVGLQESAIDAHVSSEDGARRQARPIATVQSTGFSQVSRVAEVARVADVARVATVATPGSFAADGSASTSIPGGTTSPGASVTSVGSTPVSSTGPAPSLSPDASSTGGPAHAAPNGTRIGTPNATPMGPNGVPAAPGAIATPTAPDFSDLPGFTRAPASANGTMAGAASGSAAFGTTRTGTAPVTTSSSSTASDASASGSSASIPATASSDDTADTGTDGGDSGDAGSDQAARQASAGRAEGARLGGAAPSTFRPNFAVGSTEAIRGASTLERMEQIQALQDRSAAGSDAWRLTMPDADGLGTRLRMGLRGNMVDAQIDTSDPMAAARMRTRVAELHRALEARGLEGDQFSFRSGGTEALEALAGVRGTQQSNADFVRAFMADLTGQSDTRDPRRSLNDSQFGSNGRGRDANDQNDQENRR